MIYNMHEPIYNKIGLDYDATRKADPYLTRKIIELLQPKIGHTYLDLGCGTGNYTNSLYQKKINVEGVDISKIMLDKAKEKNDKIIWHLGDICQMAFQNGSFQGAFCIFVTHHIYCLTQAFSEIFRVLLNGHFVILSATPKQMEQYWLAHYFPKMIKGGSNVLLGFDELKDMLNVAGFKNIREKKIFVRSNLQDLLLYAGKHHPEIYLNPKVREGLSAFQLFSNPQELKNGLAKLEKDILSEKIFDIIQQYKNSHGDYSFFVAEKI